MSYMQNLRLSDAIALEDALTTEGSFETELFRAWGLNSRLVECKFLLSHLDKEVQLLLFNPSSIHLQLERYLEREQQLVPLEDPRTSVVIHVVRQRVHYILQPLLYDAIGHALAQRELENVEERYERVFVHRIDRRHLGEDEEQDGATLRRRSIPVPRLVDLLGRLRSEFEFLADLNDRRSVILCQFAYRNISSIERYSDYK